MSTTESSSSAYSAQINSWTTAVTSLFAARSVLPSVYSSKWYINLSGTEQLRVQALVDEVWKSITPFGEMLKQGIAQMKAGSPPDVLPPPYLMPATWSIPSQQSLLTAIWGALQPTMIILLEKIDVNGNEILKLVMLGVLFDIDNLITAFSDIVED